MPFGVVYDSRLSLVQVCWLQLCQASLVWQQAPRCLRRLFVKVLLWILIHRRTKSG